jgi:hypothetical protein
METDERESDWVQNAIGESEQTLTPRSVVVRVPEEVDGPPKGWSWLSEVVSCGVQLDKVSDHDEGEGASE